MASRKVEDLTEKMQGLFYKFDEGMKAAGISYMITCTARTVQEQHALFLQGRQSLEVVNRARKQIGLSPITEEENRRPVTWTMQSKHIVNWEDSDPNNNKSRAFDIAIVSEGRPTWNLKVDVNKNLLPDYIEAGKIGKSVGLRWGGDFRKPDWPHFEEPV